MLGRLPLRPVLLFEPSAFEVVCNGRTHVHGGGRGED